MNRFVGYIISKTKDVYKHMPEGDVIPGKVVALVYYPRKRKFFLPNPGVWIPGGENEPVLPGILQEISFHKRYFVFGW